MLSAQAVRNWQLASYILCPIVAYELVFRTNYNTEKNQGQHIFTGIQSWYNDKVDELIMGKDWKRNGLLREMRTAQQLEEKGQIENDKN